MGIRHAIRFILLPRSLGRVFPRHFGTWPQYKTFIEENFNPILGKYKDVDLSTIKTTNPDIIWVFWWQGESGMPNVIHEYYESVLRNANSRKVILLTEQNYAEYVK